MICPVSGVNAAFPVVSDAVGTPAAGAPAQTSVAAAKSAVGNLLSNVAPPSALPSFITNPVCIPPGVLTSQPQESVKIEGVKPPTQLPEGLQTTELTVSASSDNMPQVLDAPDSPTIDTGALAGSLFTWMKDTVANSNMLSKVAEKAKNSVNSMITTLDPQMREFICEYIINFYQNIYNHLMCDHKCHQYSTFTFTRHIIKH